jgi:iron complex outermembrane receptor protein
LNYAYLAAPMAAVLLLCPATSFAQAPDGDLSQLSIEDLSNLEVTSVSRRAAPLSQAPAAIFVITRDDIERTGAQSLPEALRLAPNLQVARLDTLSYAISARGFNHATSTANKLQVLIDGRSVYTPLFSGVFWDEQNVLLDDVDRVEVISGPGGTLWGANAVNGVINVTTRDAHETLGGLASLGGGNYDQDVALRYGARLTDKLSARVYAMATRDGPGTLSSGLAARDERENAQVGFRGDWAGAVTTFTLQGDYAGGDLEYVPGALRRTSINGGNLLGRWTARMRDESVFEAQASYTNSQRSASTGIDAKLDAYTLDWQYNLAPGRRHTAIVGGGYRRTDDSLLPGPRTAMLSPAQRTLELWHLYAQDSISLAEDVDLVGGLKIESNDYTGVEYMPNLVLSWRPADDALLWTAISRAVRTPSRADTELINPGIIAGGPNFDSEYLTAYELGFRGRPAERLSFSVSTYLNVYDDLRTLEGTTPAAYPLVIENKMHGQTYGVEAWGIYALSANWRLSAGMSWMQKELKLDAGSRDPLGVGFAGNDPMVQGSLRSSLNLTPDIDFDVTLRGVDELPSPAVPAYAELDARFGWRLTERLEFSITGANLLHEQHLEFASNGIAPISVPRSVFARTRWRF